MPELPEVETVRRGLDKLIVGRKVKQVKSDNPRSFPNTETDVRLFLVGATITAVRRRAKVLMIDLSTSYTLVIHLKMTGQMVYIKEGLAASARGDHSLNLGSGNPDTSLQASFRGRGENSEFTSESSGGAGPSLDMGSESTDSDTRTRPSGSQIRERGAGSELISEPSGGAGPSSDIRFGAGHPNDSLIGRLPDKSTRVTINFEDDTNLFFNDQRKFGWMKLLPTVEVPNIDFMRKVGPEPLESNFSPQDFRQRFARRQRTNIKAALLDQSVIAGVGNIYADESLWMSKIHPLRLVGSISDEEFESLYRSVRDVMNLSIEKGGSTDRNYVDAEGRRGSYMDFANVFRREGQACNRCGQEIIKTRVAGRGTHICPFCQVPPAEA